VRVTAALLGRFTETEPDGGLLNIVGGGTDLFGCPEVPVEFAMPFALQLRYPESEAEDYGAHSVSVLIDGAEQATIPYQIVASAN
jgi:hypothetical protein